VTARSLEDADKVLAQVRLALGTAPQSGRPQARASNLPPASSSPAKDAFGDLPEFEIIRVQRAVGELAGISNPWHRLHDGRADARTSIDGATILNFSSYDYLGLNGHPEVIQAAKEAIDRFGTTVSASRLTAGERIVHRELESSLARLHGVEAALAFVSGHATNVSVIGGLLGPQDLIVSDALIHNSVVEGAKLSGAQRIMSPHGDLEALERILRLHRSRHRRALIVTEGLFSMDGDMPDLAALIRLKNQYNCWLMVDEAHSVGVLGATGRGVAEEQSVDPRDVEIWMGTLSKTFSATGGYIAGSRQLIDLVKYTSGGFVFSVGLSPPLAAAANTSIGLMMNEPHRLKRLRENGSNFLRAAKALGLDTGPSIGAAVIPVVVGNSPHAVLLSQRLLGRGYNVVPAIFPGVAENQARLRFFLTATHERSHIDGVLACLAEEFAKVQSGPSFVDMISSVDLD
jgi:8-amino-7-oxononanoate synthase